MYKKTVDDLMRQYIGCFIKDGDKDPVQIVEFIESEEGIVYVYDNYEKNSLWNENNIKPYPTLGAINVKNSVVYLTREGERQYTKGLNLFYINQYSPTKIRYTTEELVKSIYDNKYYEVKEAVRMINLLKRKGCAISKYYYISKCMDHIYLFRKHFLIGEIQKNLQINLLFPHYDSFIEKLGFKIL